LEPSVCKFISAEQSSSLQVAVESSTDQHHADGNAEQCGPDASLETLGIDTNAMRLNGSRP
jgi:hypothetical protein